MGGGGGGVTTPPPPPKSSEPYIQNTLLILYLACRKRIDLHCNDMSMVVVVVSFEQVVKPRSRRAAVEPEVLHLLECQLLELYKVSIRARSIKMGVAQKFSRALCAHWYYNPTIIIILDPPLHHGT